METESQTHCDIITALSNKMTLIVNLEQRFINCIVKKLNCSNPLFSIVCKIALCNLMADTGCNYRNLLDCNSELKINQSIVKWKVKQEKLHKIITLYEFIDKRDAAQDCIEFTHYDILTLI